MPKVSDAYKEEKKTHIRNSVAAVLSRKTMLALTMQDIINESGLSQGNIYRYYKDLDDILTDYLANMRKNNSFIERLDAILNTEGTFDEKLTNITDLLGVFMEEGIETYCKSDFEFNSLSMNYPERAARILQMVNQSSTSNLGYLMSKALEFFAEESKRQRMRFLVEPAAMAAFISASYEGIQMTALQSYAGNSQLQWKDYRPTSQMRQLGRVLKNMIEFTNSDNE